MFRRLIPISLLFFLLTWAVPMAYSQEEPVGTYLIKPGDTWTALSLRLHLPVSELIATAGSINPQRQPVIGTTISLPQSKNEYGRLLRPYSGGILQTSARHRYSPWALALQNDILSPYKPLLYAPLVLPGGTAVPREMPSGFQTLSVSPPSGRPGQALMLQAFVDNEVEPDIRLGQEPWLVSRNKDRLLALNATGAFFGSSQVDLSIHSENNPLWTQPWQFESGNWTYEKIEFSSMPATDPETMRLERERLQELWAQATPKPLWKGSFQWPIQDYVELTSHYGARRSINGGGYDTYHEGTDFSAYGGTPVFAPAAGKVALAEPLIVRGGTVILDHGLGIHTGYYHLSEITAIPGQLIEAGQLLGKVGTTGRSTGNHLHWDLLVGTTWVDSEAWMDTGLAAQIQNAWGVEFPRLNLHDIPRNE